MQLSDISTMKPLLSGWNLASYCVQCVVLVTNPESGCYIYSHIRTITGDALYLPFHKNILVLSSICDN
jgi:hypothetical protein